MNPNGLVNQTFVWNDNGDLVFQPNELGAPSGSISAPLSADLLKQHFLLTKRPYRNEFTAGVDHQLIQALRVSVTYIQRHEQDQIVTLEQNTPNPFNPMTNIRLELAHAGDVALRIFDARGRRVRGFDLAARSAGRQTIVWDGRDTAGRELPSGVYLYEVRSAGWTGHGRMTLAK